MVKKIFFIILLCLSFCYFSHAEKIFDDVVYIYNLDTPKKIEHWVWRNIQYEKSGYTAKKPLTTYLDKTGDCLDLALLNQALLGRIGIFSVVICLKYPDKKIGHALCVYKYNNRLWVVDNFIHWRMGKKYKFRYLEDVAEYFGGKIVKKYITVITKEKK